ncbi:MAG: AlwI family type II restriction endonuclease [Clostridium sp.]|uniref:AlwI family type II restriction endonuclease n=1 Tax=Clostridium sp. TaxID=1506 RepID=UPI003F2F4B49
MQMWSLGTALRNPRRIQRFLITLQNCIERNGGSWNENDELDYYIELIRDRVVNPNNVSANELNCSQQEARMIMLDSYEDAPIRGRVLGSLFHKLGLVRITNQIQLTNLGINFMNHTTEAEFQNCLVAALSNWQINNGVSQLRGTVQGNPQSNEFNPFLATEAIITEVDRLEGRITGISFKEYIYFVKVLDSSDLILSSANLIFESRRNFNILEERINYVKLNCTNLSNDSDYADNEIKYFTNTGRMRFDRSRGILSVG